MTDAPAILVINDDPVALRLTQRTLADDGYAVTAYASAADALGSLSRGMSPDLVVADLHMPGIDGWKLCRLLRGPELPRFNHIPILVVSATFTGVDVESITRDLGANAFLPAPYHPETLKTYVRELLSGAHPQRALEVLVVEDDPDLASVVARTFEDHGYHVEQVNDGQAALEVTRDRRFDVFIVDFHLPDIDGAELMHRLRRPEEAGVVLVTTGDDDPELPVRLLEAGADGYLRKPFDPRYLLDLTQKARRERSLLRVEALLERRTNELKESDARMRALFRAIPDWVLVINWEGLVVQANEAAFRDLPEEVALVGQKLTDLLDDENRSDVQDRLAAAWSSGRGHFEARLDLCGETRVVEVAAEVTELEGDPVLLLVARNITQRREAEAARRHTDARLQRKQRMESLGVLAGGVAHDFNNLLVGILGNASLALTEVGNGPGAHSLEQIEAAARRAADLTRQVMTFAGRSQAATEPVCMGALVELLIELASSSLPEGVRLEVEVGDDLPLVEGDPGQLQQAIMNLLLNAADAVEDGPGEIHLSVTRVRDPADRPHDSAEADHPGLLGAVIGEGEFVEIRLADTGPGVDPEIRDRIFEPFFTTKFAGRGLGLSTALGIIQTHDGAIQHLPREGGGSVFRLLLPGLAGDTGHPRGGAHRRDVDHGTPETSGSGDEDSGTPASGSSGETRREDGPAGEASLQGAKVLVVDDEPAVLRMIATVLRRAGMEVFPAQDGEQALEVFREAPESWTMVLVDYSLPGMNGREVLSALRDGGWDVPVVLASGLGDERLESLVGRSLGPVAFLPKPFRPGELVDRVQALISGVAAPEAHPAGAPEGVA